MLGFVAQLVALEIAYTRPGNVAQVRLNGQEVKAVPSSRPFSMKINLPVLYKLRGDIPAGTMKLPQFSLSVKAPIELHVDEATNAELYAVTEGESGAAFFLFASHSFPCLAFMFGYPSVLVPSCRMQRMFIPPQINITSFNC